MTDQPTSIRPAALSGPYEDYRIAVARKALVESAEAKGTDRSAYQMWGYLEGTVKGLLEAVDAGKAAATPELEVMTIDELDEYAMGLSGQIERLKDELARRRAERS